MCRAVVSVSKLTERGTPRSLARRDRVAVVQRILQPVVSPEHLAADEKRRRAENPFVHSLFSLLAQAELVRIALRGVDQVLRG